MEARPIELMAARTIAAMCVPPARTLRRDLYGLDRADLPTRKKLHAASTPS